MEPIPEGDAVKLEGSVNFAEGGNSSKQKRTKERKIGEILDKVLQWRRLYTGVNDPATGQTIKMSLEDAAQRVGISKKSLDDYLLQIRSEKILRLIVICVDSVKSMDSTLTIISTRESVC